MSKLMSNARSNVPLIRLLRLYLGSFCELCRKVKSKNRNMEIVANSNSNECTENVGIYILKLPWLLCSYYDVQLEQRFEVMSRVMCHCVCELWKRNKQIEIYIHTSIHICMYGNT